MGGGGQDSDQIVSRPTSSPRAAPSADLADDGTAHARRCAACTSCSATASRPARRGPPGIGLLDAETLGGPTRLIGNTVLDTDEFGTIIGYENHSGQTTLGAGVEPFGRGHKDRQQRHGRHRRRPLPQRHCHLPARILAAQEPCLADYLIRHAAERRYGSFNDVPLEIPYEAEARTDAAARPR